MAKTLPWDFRKGGTFGAFVALLGIIDYPTAVLKSAAHYISLGFMLGGTLFFSIHCTTSDVSRTIGARCSDRSDCSERCLSGGMIPGGMCTQSCEKDEDCPDGAQCAEFEGGVCLYTCGLNEDCNFLGQEWGCVNTKSTESEEEELSVCLAR